MNAAVATALGPTMQVTLRKGDRVEQHRVRATDGVVTIGRDSRCTIPLKTALASRQHAVIDVRGPSMKVRDTSMNGTHAGHELLRGATVELPYGTEIAIGEFVIVLWPEAAMPARPVAAPAPAPVVVSPAALPAMPAAPAAPAQVAPAAPAFVAASPAPEAAAPAADASDSDARRAEVALRSEIHRQLLEHLDLSSMAASNVDDPALRPKVLTALRKIVASMGARLPEGTDKDVLVGALADEALGLGPLERFLSDPTVNEIMVVDPSTIYVERAGKLELSGAHFTDDERVRAAIERIVTPLGRRIDESVPLVDARLKDGSRVNAVIKPLALRGSAITIRKFSKKPLTLDALAGLGAMTPAMSKFLKRAVMAKKNIVISGGTGSGKTTLLNALSGAIPADERVVTVEDAAELQLKQPHVVSLETRPANMEGKGEYTIRDLVKNALRMRPDRIVVGECRGGEALDMLQAMNTGHDGSLTTTHANSPRDAISRLETLCLMAGIDLPVRAIREQLAGAVHIIVQQSRLGDGSRRVTAITEVTGIDTDGEITLVPIFEFERTGTGPKGKVLGEYRATGFLPTFLNDFIVLGLIGEGESYL